MTAAVDLSAPWAALLAAVVMLTLGWLALKLLDL